MNDPYSILGVPQNASNEQIREAYRSLARRCQEQIDAGVDVASAQRQMQELDEAYDAVILGRSSDPGTYSYVQSDYSDIRRTIREGRFADAQTILDGIPEERRDAEWHFLKGTVQQRKGWLDEAFGNFATACRLDPDNAEYRAAYDNMQNSRSGGYRTQRSGGSRISPCDICTGLLCADCCCECMGGDLISCC